MDRCLGFNGIWHASSGNIMSEEV